MLSQRRSSVAMESEPFYKDAAAWLGAGLVAFLAWLARWAWGKLDAKADRAELLELVRRQEQRDVETRQSRERLYEKLDECKEQVNALAVAVGRLEGPKG